MKAVGYQIFVASISERIRDEYGMWICPNCVDMKDTIIRLGYIGYLNREQYDKLIVFFDLREKIHIMREIGLEDLRRIQLAMLKDIHSFCIANGIKYSLACGTLLGAVRHKGYIPWDDDVDLMIPRDDYDRFVSSYGNERYQVVDLTKDSHYDWTFAKVHDVRTRLVENCISKNEYGVYIDVFPVDHIPDSASERKNHYRKKNFWNALHIFKTVRLNSHRSLIKNLILVIGRIVSFPLSKALIVQEMDKISRKYQGKETEYVGIVAPTDSKLEEAIPAKFFKDYVELPFENATFLAIKAYEEYLTATYGDYMKLPPEEKRVSHHDFEAWWI